MPQMILSTKQKQTTDRDKRLVLVKGEEVEGGVEWECGVSRSKLLYTEWIHNKVLL